MRFFRKIYQKLFGSDAPDTDLLELGNLNSDDLEAGTPAGSSSDEQSISSLPDLEFPEPEKVNRPSSVQNNNGFSSFWQRATDDASILQSENGELTRSSSPAAAADGDNDELLWSREIDGFSSDGDNGFSSSRYSRGLYDGLAQQFYSGALPRSSSPAAAAADGDDDGFIMSRDTDNFSSGVVNGFSSSSRGLFDQATDVSPQPFSSGVLSRSAGNERSPLLGSVGFNSFKNQNKIRITKNPVHQGVIFNQTENLKTFLRPEVGGIPFEDGRVKQFAQWYKGLVSYYLFTLRNVIPAGFAALLMHDLIMNEINPDERFGADTSSILIGSAENEQSWSCHLGTYERGDLSPLAWPFILSLPPALFPAIFYSISRYLPSTEITKLKEQILWASESFRDKEDSINSLYQKINAGGFKKYLSLFALSEIAGSFNPRSLVRFNLTDEQYQALDALRVEITDKMIRQSGLTASYLRWGLNPFQLSLKAPFWAPRLTWGTFALYANVRYGAVFFKSIFDYLAFVIEKNACEIKQNHYSWTEATANYECTACGDWPFVSYRESLSANSCLDQLLKQDFSPEKLTRYAQELGDNRTIYSIDLSAQPWFSWSDEELSPLLGSLQKIAAPGIETLRFSNAQATIPPTLAKMRIVSEFINNIQAQRIDLSGLMLDEYLLENCLNILDQNNLIQELIISNTMLSDESIEVLSQNLRKFSQLQRLVLSDTRLTNTGLTVLAEGLVKNPGVIDLDISNNQLDARGFDGLAKNWINNTIESLNVSGNSLTSEAANSLSLAMKQRALRHLLAENCGLDDEGFLAFADAVASLESFSVANNVITDVGLQYFIHLAKLQRLRALNLASNQFTDQSMPVLAQTLADTNITDVNLSQNLLTPIGLKDVVDYLPQTQINNLELQGIEFGDEAAAVLAQGYKNSSQPLLRLNLSNTGLTSQGAKTLFASKTSLLSLNLENNLMDESIKQNLYEFLEANPQLQIANIASNQLDGSFVENLAQHLRDSNLVHFNFAGNGVAPTSMTSFASQLIAPIPPGVQLDASQLSLDARRALMRASPTTRLQTIELDNAETTQERIAFNRLNTAINLQVQTRIPEINRLSFFNSPITANATPQRATNQVVLGLAMSPFAVSLIIAAGIVGVVMLAHLIYRTVSCCQSKRSVGDKQRALLGDRQ